MTTTTKTALESLRDEARAIRRQLDALEARARKVEDADPDDFDAAALRSAIEEAAWALEGEGC